MTNIFELLSGGIPGGAILLIAALIFTNLAVHFLFKSGLFSTNLAKKYIISNAIVLAFYTFLWNYNKPVPLPERIIVLPSTEEQGFKLEARSLILAELFEQYGYKIEGRYLAHKWRWLYQTLGEERAVSYERWLELARGLQPTLLITSEFAAEDELLINASFLQSDSKTINAKMSLNNTAADFRALLNDLSLKLEKGIQVVPPDDKYLTTKLKIVKGDLDTAYNLVADDTTNAGLLLKGETLVYKGLQFVYDQEKLNFVDIVNPDFERAKSILYPLIRADYRSTQVAYLLGRMAIREQEYEGAEVFFKIAFSEELWNSDIYYYLSFLLPSRLEELGYKDRKKILERAVQLNPGNTNAAYDLADRYYITGNGVEQGSGTQDALRTLENYLLLNDEDPKIQSQLATLYIKTEKLDLAEAIYNKMAQRFPEDSNIIYNLGIVYFTAGQYRKALEKFLQAIGMDDNLDAYLYTGITYERLDKPDKALEYYRSRVRNKKSDDDFYAREAMRGIRKILERQVNQGQDSAATDL